MLIVFGALMALIALVAVAIDWVGKPLRNRRFIPRIYRYGDEIPGTLEAGGGFGTPAQIPVAYPTAPPPHAAVAQPYAPAHLAPAAPALHPADPNTAASPEPLTTIPAASAPPAPVLASASAFSDSVVTNDGPTQSDRIASTVPVQSANAWQPGMALDSRVRDQSPSPAEKAERFWKTFAHRHGPGSHFDDAMLALMAEGKAPRRRNPRNGAVESVELVGLRAASQLDDVRMLWPDDSADPWSGS